ncbi:MAG TPA: hypothetical protein VH639_17335 [Bryobacteraceae bacterium]|jgi:hypothetical protein
MAFHKYSLWIFGALLIAAPAWAQQRAYDKVVVDLPANTWIGGEKLAAGKYELRQLPSPGDASKIILANEKTDRRYTASAISERSLRNIPPQETQVTLQRIGEDYYLDHIWIAGKEFGYKFALPAEARSRIQEIEQPLTLSATFTAPQPVVAQAAPPPPPPAPPPPPQAQPQPEQPAQAQPAPTPVPEAPPPTPELPKTASNWASILAAGAASLALGLALRLITRSRA